MRISSKKNDRKIISKFRSLRKKIFIDGKPGMYCSVHGEAEEFDRLLALAEIGYNNIHSKVDLWYCPECRMEIPRDQMVFSGMDGACIYCWNRINLDKNLEGAISELDHVFGLVDRVSRRNKK